MCGLAGIWAPTGIVEAELRRDLTNMSATLAHRGPDSSGVWVDREAGFGIGFRRLAIQDLSAAGDQPMQSSDGRFVLALNGEIYNFGALEQELGALGSQFLGRSDTEVALEAIRVWGVLEAVRKFNGMFALALWDRVDRTLTLARDRFGEKPLYFGTINGTLVFASELSAIRQFPPFQARIDPSALRSYLALGFVPAPASIYAGLHKLMPAEMRVIRSDLAAHSATYWKLDQPPRRGFQMDDVGVVDSLAITLQDAVALRMIADVPVGAFLSGGVDSSLIVALMQQTNKGDVRTFSIGFTDRQYDESAHARVVADQLGTDHTDQILHPRDAMDLLPDVHGAFDEPFADVSQIPMLLVARVARRQVKVCLSGDGADELFGGYGRYRRTLRLARMRRLLPDYLRRPVGTALSSAGDGWLGDRAWGSLPSLRSRRIATLGEALRAEDLRDVYERTFEGTRRHSGLTLGGGDPGPARATWDSGDLASSMMAHDLARYLPDDILVKLDRATMAVGLEARAPFLDHRVGEAAWRLPSSVKMRERGKWPLKVLLRRYLPGALVSRPKMGFDVPIGSWLCGPLEAWASDLLATERIRSEGLLDPAAVGGLWAEHSAAQHDHGRILWALLMFESWLDDQQRSAATHPPARCER